MPTRTREQPRRGEASTLASVHGALYQLIAVNIAAPRHAGTIVVGFRLDDRVAGDLGAIADTRTSQVRLDARQRWEVAASNLDAASRQQLAASLNPLATMETAPSQSPAAPRMISLRQTDTVARLGGDEFAILLPTATPSTARKVVNNLLLALEASMDIEGQRIDLQGSFGIATAPEHSADPATLLRYADVAMYKAKQDNLGFAEYDTRYDQNTLDRLSLMSELREAVEHDQLVLFYQPKVDLKHNDACAVEALVRWVHPQRGLVPPDRFIPFAEHTGYIKEITRWVLREGVRQCSLWQRAGLDVNISINLSARDLMNAELPVYFAALLNTHQVDPTASAWKSPKARCSTTHATPSKTSNGWRPPAASWRWTITAPAIPPFRI